MSNLPPDIQGLSLIESSFKPKDISLPLPLTPHTTLHIKLSLLEKNTVVFLTSTDYSTSGTSSPLGSFVYAMPNRLDQSNSFCTALITVPSSIEFATRVGKILARRTGKPTYVGCSVGLGGASVEEEVEGIKAVVGAIVEEAARSSAKVNGI
ncbi:MAG: hypothetical protein MMC23_000669 [Stictis urceolatum]|nr:hypothetical protein [Stictis urceolata]